MQLLALSQAILLTAWHDLTAGFAAELQLRSRHVEPGGHPLHPPKWAAAVLGGHRGRHFQDGPQGLPPLPQKALNSAQ